MYSYTYTNLYTGTNNDGNEMKSAEEEDANMNTINNYYNIVKETDQNDTKITNDDTNNPESTPAIPGIYVNRCTCY
jgi:hypothetical protein